LWTTVPDDEDVDEPAILDDVRADRCATSHEPAPPRLSRNEPAAQYDGDCDDDVADVWLSQARILSLDLDRPELIDIALDDCDVSGIVANDFIARRLAVRRTRLRGVTLAGGQLDDGLVEDCITRELSARFSRLRRVVIRSCDLSGADFYGVTFDHVTIEGCDLQRATFDGATARCLTITDCNLAGVTGAFSLKGARLDAADLPALAISLAREAGIDIQHD
jgi:uncharacterized protein YjbI with pentapeptide repeats